MRILKTVFIFLLLFGAALLAGRFFFLDQSAVFLVQQLGADDVGVQGVSIDSRQVCVDKMAAVLKLSDGNVVHVEMHNVSFQYDLQQLVRTGKGKRLVIEKMDVTLTRKNKKDENKAGSIPEQIVLMKESLRARLPLGKVTVKQLQVHGDFPAQLLDKDVQLDAALKELALSATLTIQLSEELRVGIELQSPDSVHATATLVAQNLNREKAEVVLELTPESVSGKTDLDLKKIHNLFFEDNNGSTFSNSSGLLSVSLNIPLTGNDKTASAAIKLTDFDMKGGSASFIGGQFAGRITGGGLVLDPESKVVAQQIHFGTTDIKELFFDIAGDYTQLKDEVQIHLSNQQKLEIRGLTSGKLQFSNFNLQLQNSLQVTIDTDKKDWSVVDNILHISRLQIQEGLRSIDCAPINCSFTGLTRSFLDSGLLVEIQTPSAILSNGLQGMPLEVISGTVQLKQNTVKGKLQLGPRDVPARVDVTFEHDIESSIGKFDFQTDTSLELGSEETALSSLFTAWQYPFDLDDGSLSFRGGGSWSASTPIQLAVFMTLSGGSGYYKQFLFEGLDFRQDLTVLPEIMSETSGNLALQHLIGGIDVYDIRADVNVSPSKIGKLPLLQIDDFNASLFDGTIKASTIQYDLNQPDSNFVVDISAVNLSALVNLIEMDNLKVTGRVSGSIPVTIKGRDVSVSDGELHSKVPGGEIRYLPGTMNQSGLTGYALKAIENLQYKTLSVKVGYIPSGQLDLDIGLQGTSPQLQTSRPVHLNVHAEQNLQALMQSLRFSRGLSEELDKRVKQHYN